jgi:tRNA nucleotidyltransferase (CCA-adding enzyme)
VSRNLSKALKESLEPAQLEILQLVSAEASALGFPLYIAGGLVRDLLLGRASTDFDLVVEGDAPTLARVLSGKYSGKVTIHSKFGTAKWDLEESRIRNGISTKAIGSHLKNVNSLDLISARSEIYKHPASLPTVKMGRISDDLQRRDFTINALAIRVDTSHFGELIDDFQGVHDVEKGIVRVLHPRSFIDDPTRMYRAVRYEQRLGFKIDQETLALLPKARFLIDKLSAQRIKHELDLILDELNPAAHLGRLAELGLLKPIHAALPWDETVKERLKSKPGIEILHPTTTQALDEQIDNCLIAWSLWLQGLTERQIESVNKRLHFTASNLKILLAVSRLNDSLGILSEWKPSQCVEYLDELPIQAIQAVFIATSDANLNLPLKKYLGVWRHVRPRTSGHDLKKLGVPQGPEYRRILRKLRNAWLDGEVKDEKGEQKYLEDVLRKAIGLEG